MSDPAVFGSRYAGQYDLLYSDKDYEAECDLLQEVFQRHAGAPVQDVLDLGCGTGNHALPLARRGYRVTGVDRSPEMLAHADRKAARDADALRDGAPVFRCGDARNLDLGQQFDAVLMMFAVLGYQLANEDVLAALRTVRRHLQPGGLFVCDVWYGPAVLSIRPGDRVKEIPTAGGKLVRAAEGTLDTYRHLCRVRYRVSQVGVEQAPEASEEIHWMRFFFPQELALFMSQCDLQLVEMRAFDDPERPPDETSWNALAVARAGGAP
jgi:SAM-dependent methyltransferase